MVRPAHFGFNAETAANNAFQTNDGRLSSEEISIKAIEEFDRLVNHLSSNGINVIVIQDTDIPVKSDAVFPNNWVSFHQDGKVITYPMFSPIRRQERREEIIETLAKKFLITNRLHMESAEDREVFLEGTGSMILDRVNKIVYACLSIRTDLQLLDEFCEKTGYKKVTFGAFDANGLEIYHTNVMMGLGIGFAVVCLDAVRDPAEKLLLQNSLESTGFEIIPLTFHQMNNFAGNLLQVMAEDGTPYVILSQRAYDSLTDSQLAVMRRNSKVLPVPLDIIEVIGGGSVRCMMTEIFES